MSKQEHLDRARRLFCVTGLLASMWLAVLFYGIGSGDGKPHFGAVGEVAFLGLAALGLVLAALGWFHAIKAGRTA